MVALVETHGPGGVQHERHVLSTSVLSCSSILRGIFGPVSSVHTVSVSPRLSGTGRTCTVHGTRSNLGQRNHRSALCISGECGEILSGTGGLLRNAGAIAQSEENRILHHSSFITHGLCRSIFQLLGSRGGIRGDPCAGHIFGLLDLLQSRLIGHGGNFRLHAVIVDHVVRLVIALYQLVCGAFAFLRGPHLELVITLGALGLVIGSRVAGAQCSPSNHHRDDQQQREKRQPHPRGNAVVSRAVTVPTHISSRGW